MYLTSVLNAKSLCQLESFIKTQAQKPARPALTIDQIKHLTTDRNGHLLLQVSVSITRHNLSLLEFKEIRSIIKPKKAKTETTEVAHGNSC